jgi:CubicO group peptidase (beta-lactamase class C family)
MADAHDPPPVDGHCEPGFEPLRRALADILAAGAEVGAALAVYVDKHLVVDVWAGHMDAARTRPWRSDTIVNLYSVGKAVTAVCALRLVDAGALDLDAPIARYWLEFAQAGKARILVRHALAHQAGLPAVARRLPSGAEVQWDVMTEALAAQAPWWEPGTAHGYHVNTHGFLLGEVVRRVTGRTLGTYLREEIGAPGGIDFFVGFGPELDPRCAEMVPPRPSPETEELQRRLSVDPDTVTGLALMLRNTYLNPPGLSGRGVVNTRAWRAAELPSTNGHGHARAVARLYAAQNARLS